MLEALLIIFGVFAMVFTVAVLKVDKDAEKEKENAENTVVKTKFIDSSHTATSSSRTKAGSALARGAVGGALLGPVGMVAGAASAKKKTVVKESHTTTFMVYYEDGTHKAETVSNSSALYEIYMSKLEM